MYLFQELFRFFKCFCWWSVLAIKMELVNMHSSMALVLLQLINKQGICMFLINLTTWFERSLLKVCLSHCSSTSFLSASLHFEFSLEPGEVTTLAGSSQGFADGIGNASKFNFPEGIWFEEKSRSLLVSDYHNSKLRRVELNGIDHKSVSSPINFDTGKVSTLCDVPSLCGVTSSCDTIFVCSPNKIFKITLTGLTFVFFMNIVLCNYSCSI